MTLREETIHRLRARGKTEEEIEAHMAKVDALMSELAEVAPRTFDMVSGTWIPTAQVLDFDRHGRAS